MGRNLSIIVYAQRVLDRVEKCLNKALYTDFSELLIYKYVLQISKRGCGWSISQFFDHKIFVFFREILYHVAVLGNAL